MKKQSEEDERHDEGRVVYLHVNSSTRHTQRTSGQNQTCWRNKHLESHQVLIRSGFLTGGELRDDEETRDE